MSIVHMPNSMRWLCVTHCLSWMSLLCYSLYFTDFVGEEVYGGKPFQTYSANDSSHLIYDSGVRYGSFCMAIYSISCSFYSFFLQYLIKCFRKPLIFPSFFISRNLSWNFFFFYVKGTRNIYRFSQISYSVGMLILALTRNKIVATLASFTAGMIYSSLFTIPFILLANYHSCENVSHYRIHLISLNYNKSFFFQPSLIWYHMRTSRSRQTNTVRQMSRRALVKQRRVQRSVVLELICRW